MPQLETSTFLSQIFWLLITFFSLWFMMSWFIIPRIEEIIEQRRQKIDSYIQKAEKINKLALQSLEKYEKSLQKAKQEAEERIAQNKAELSQSIAEKHAEIEDILNRKIADNEYMLAKERIDTLSAINDISLSLASEIISRLDIEPVDKEKLKMTIADKDISDEQ